MPWIDILILDVQAYADDPKKPPLVTVFGQTEDGTPKSFRVFANQRRKPDAQGQQPFYFSDHLETLVIALTKPVTFSDYYAAVQNNDEERAGVLRDAMFAAMRDLAAQLASKEPNAVAEVANALRSYLAGRVIRIDWNETGNYPGPNRHVLPFFPSEKDGQPSFGGKLVKELVDNFEPGSIKQAMDQANMALRELPGLPQNYVQQMQAASAGGDGQVQQQQQQPAAGYQQQQQLQGQPQGGYPQQQQYAQAPPQGQYQQPPQGQYQQPPQGQQMQQPPQGQQMQQGGYPQQQGQFQQPPQGQPQGNLPSPQGGQPGQQQQAADPQQQGIFTQGQ